VKRTLVIEKHDPSGGVFRIADIAAHRLLVPTDFYRFALAHLASFSALIWRGVHDAYHDGPAPRNNYRARN
jgi:hypothetical protein